MKKLLNSTLLIILVLVVVNVSAQPDPRVSQPNNVVIKRIANKVEKTGWITYKRGIKLTGHEIFGELKDAFGLSPDDSMQEKASQNDES